ncbi:DUF1365 domain-containing protein [Zooshikella harenae]|uniref:DUF1365 domain-containing protein n=1 Tax=Zooshikella harenae TaxID=2827238 RepID=A0ABS5Z7G1_9GAMM|nr:DUF1365 domain-containing protein [Zooshikella harenae]MBU2709873.1 DUF1365 domain-containing protein [Zooshikella harenae]
MKNKPALMLYKSNVMHQRFFPVNYKFNYSVFNIAIDVLQLESAHTQCRFFSVNRFNLFSFYPKDLGPRDGSDLAKWIKSLLYKHQLFFNPQRIILFCFPRVLGYSFNPLANWYCFDEQNELKAIVLEVSNTFNESHYYVLSPNHDHFKTTIYAKREKNFHVSPFLAMDMDYEFRLSPFNDKVFTHIKTYQDQKLMLLATQHSQRIPANNKQLIKLFLSIPLMTWKVITMIHWHALKLWLQKVPIFSHPKQHKKGVSHG